MVDNGAIITVELQVGCGVAEVRLTEYDGDVEMHLSGA